MRARRVQVSYTDQQNSLKTEFENLDVIVRGFSWDKPFDLTASAVWKYQRGAAPFSADFRLTARADLASLNWPQASMELTSFALRAGEMRTVFSGRAENFENPTFDFKLDGQYISSAALTPFVVGNFPFNFARLSAHVQGNAWPEQAKVALTQAGLSIPGAEIMTSGTAQWERNEYDLSARADVQMADLAENFPELKSYALGGNITVQAQAAPKKLSARAEWKTGKMHLVQLGKISDLRVVLDAAESWDFFNGKR